MKRLFFALWPDESVLKKINQDALASFANCQGNLIKTHNWHITLAYFGAANKDMQQCLEQQAEKIKSQAFELHLSQLGYWSKVKVAWLAPNEIPTELSRLANELQSLIIPCGYKAESRAYQPHLSIMRKAKKAPAVTEISTIKMLVSKFCLAESLSTTSGVEYKILRSWDLSL